MTRPTATFVVPAAVATGKHPTARVREVIVEDVIYRCNGWDQPWWLDESGSAEYPIGSLVPDSGDVTVADSASGTGFASGAVVEGRITYYNSSLPNGGKETAPYYFKHTMSANRDLSITISDPSAIQAQFTEARYYRKLPGGNYKLHTTKTGSWATPITDTNSDITANDQQVRRFRETLPPIFSWMEFWKGYLLGCTGTDSLVYWAQMRRVSGEGNVTCDFPSASFMPIFPNDGLGHVTAIVSEWENLIVFKEHGIYRISGDTRESASVRRITAGVGCIAPHSIVSVSGVIFFLDERGVYMLLRDGQPALVAAAEGTNGSPLQTIWDEINRNAAHMLHAAHNRAEGTYELHIPWGDEPTPDRAAIYDYRSSFDRFMGLDDRWFTVAGDVLDASGVRYPLAIDDLGTLWQYDQGDIDGADGGTYTAGVSSGNSTLVTLDSAALTGTSYRGTRMLARESDGSLRWRNRAHSAPTTSTIAPLYVEATALAGTDTAKWGVIPAKLHLPASDFGDPRYEKDLKTIAVMHKTETGGELDVVVGLDEATPDNNASNIPTVDLSTTSGYSIVPTGGMTAHRVQIGFENENADEPWAISSLDLEYSVRVEDQ